MEPQSIVHISGSISLTCSSLSVAPTISVPSSFNGSGCSAEPKTISPPIPEVRFKTISTFDSLMKLTTSTYKAGSRAGAPVFGSLT